MRLRSLVLSVLLCAVVFRVNGSVVYVNAAQTNNVPDGQSWPTAFGKVREAIQAASNGDAVWVAAGTYFENLTLSNGVALYGGFAGSETNLSERNWMIHRTILDGQRSNSVITISPGTNTTRVDGFTIQNGKANSGGGINCVSNSPIIANNAIIQNEATNRGGGLSFASSSPFVVSNLIAGNSVQMAFPFSGSEGAGGLGCANSSPKIFYNRIIGNSYVGTSQAGAGGIYCSGGESIEIAGNVLLANTADQGPGNAGGILLRNVNSARVSNNTIAWCLTQYLGGGIDCDSSTAIIANNIIAFCSGGIRGVSGIQFKNNCVFSNQNQLDYSGVPDQTGTNGNISVNPQFVPNFWYPDPHLLFSSPCRDAGDNSVVSPDSVDVDGEIRISGPAVDIGADEFDGTTPVFTPTIVRVSTNGNDDNDGTSWAKAKRTIQAAVEQTTLTAGEVWVHAGEYDEHIVLRPFVHLYGGFSGTESNRTQRNWNANASVLDGMHQGSVITITNLLQWNTIDGFVIRNGRANSGAGIYSSQSSPAITHNIITNNTATVQGGGINAALGSPTISQNIVSFNQAQAGGGVCCEGYGSSAQIFQNRFEANAAFQTNGGPGPGDFASGGGAIFVHGDVTPTIANNFFFRNVATNSSFSYRGQGGAICVDTVPRGAVIVNNTFIGNLAPNPQSFYKDNGGAIYSQSFRTLIVNNLIAYGSSGIITFRLSSDTNHDNVRNNCLYGNASNYVQMPDITGTNGNISVDPLLIVSEDFHLSSNSPCINSGNNSYATNNPDLVGNPRISGGTVDIGAQEFPSPASVISYAWLQQYGLTNDGSADSSDSDLDHVNNWQEWIAGTNPTNAASVLKMLPPVLAGSNVSVSWQSVAGKTYFLDRSTNLASAPPFVTLRSNIVGMAGITSFVDTNASGSGPVVYRVGVRP